MILYITRHKKHCHNVYHIFACTAFFHLNILHKGNMLWFVFTQAAVHLNCYRFHLSLFHLYPNCMNYLIKMCYLFNDIV